MKTKKLGILGGGQLGKMLCQAAADWHQAVHVLDESVQFPAGPYATTFREGSFRNEADVLAFGRTVDVLTIEIEHIDTKALHQLVSEGIEVYPQPQVIETIKDKGLQKRFYRQHDLPTAPFELFADAAAVKEAVHEGRWRYPFVQKVRTGGYDGRGVAIIRSADDLDDKLLPGPCLLEQLADIEKELAAVVARSTTGEISVFPCVEMEFHPTANLVEYLLCPASIPGDVQAQVASLARQVAEAFEVVGLLAVELFLNKDGSIWINEVAPRPHNSGHHTIEACITSQYQQHLRAILGLPLGDPSLIRPAAMANILGGDGYTGPVVYEGLDQLFAIPGVYPHIYGKEITKPFRKMGHLTAIGDTLAIARQKAEEASQLLHVRSAEITSD
ncbi:MAG: 5-(carboxyamino)imidazole ribonucleotide synthase [Bacteroidota bacterium]